MVNSFTNRPPGVQLWGFADLQLVAGTAEGSWVTVEGVTLVFINQQGRQVDPLWHSVLVREASGLGTLTVDTSATGVVVVSSNGDDASLVRVVAHHPIAES